MAFKPVKFCVGLVLVGMLCAGAMAQSGCSSVIISLLPCLNFVTGKSSTPPTSCCSQLASVVKSQPRCLCSVLLNGRGAGIAINQTQALALPSACNVQTPPVSRCNTVNGPAISPQASSPASMIAGKWMINNPRNRKGSECNLARASGV